jgi:prolyl-tRNA synthetase
MRGDRTLNEIKLCNFLGCNHVQLADEAVVNKVTGAPSGFSGPIGLSCRVLADQEIATMSDFGLGANEANYHLTGANYGRDFQVETFVDLRQATAGDSCPRCEGKLEAWRGIEVGHVFKLGTKYSDSMHATVLDDQGRERTLIMGCYGIGVGRAAAASIEQNHDANGIVWPMPLAPFQVIVTMLNPNDEAVSAAGEALYQELVEQGIEVLLDDRDERPGSKFKDADLLGIPLRVNVGARGLKEQSFELQERRSGERLLLPIESAGAEIFARVRAALDAV